MVREGKCTFSVKVAKDNILLVRVSVLHTEAEVSDRPRARTVCLESFLFRSEDRPCLVVVCSQGYDTVGPKRIKSICKFDRAVVVQPSRITLFVEENSVALKLSVIPIIAMD